jgi:hypothetical protein
MNFMAAVTVITAACDSVEAGKMRRVKNIAAELRGECDGAGEL